MTTKKHKKVYIFNRDLSIGSTIDVDKLYPEWLDLITTKCELEGARHYKGLFM